MSSVSLSRSRRICNDWRSLVSVRMGESVRPNPDIFFLCDCAPLSSFARTPASYAANIAISALGRGCAFFRNCVSIATVREESARVVEIWPMTSSLTIGVRINAPTVLLRP